MAHGPQTARIVLTPEEREALTRWARRGRTAQALALRAPPAAFTSPDALGAALHA